MEVTLAKQAQNK